MQIRQASRRGRPIRMAIAGPPGSGKTFTAFRIAAKLAADLGKPWGVIDSEAGSAEDYAGAKNPDGGEFNFLVIDMSAERDKYTPENYHLAMKGMANVGVGVLVIDSFSHAWAGAGGMLERVDQIGARKAGGNWSAWADVTPLQNQLIEAVLSWPGHVIVTMRTKMAWVLEERNGRQNPRQVGTEPVQRQGVGYEFTLAGEMDDQNTLFFSKSRLDTYVPVGSWMQRPGADLAQRILDWQASRAGTDEPVVVAEIHPEGDRLDIAEALQTVHKKWGVPLLTPDELDSFLAHGGGKRMAERTVDQQRQLIRSLGGDKGKARLREWLADHARLELEEREATPTGTSDPATETGPSDAGDPAPASDPPAESSEPSEPAKRQRRRRAP